MHNQDVRVRCFGKRVETAQRCPECLRGMKAHDGLFCGRWYPKVCRADGKWLVLVVGGDWPNMRYARVGDGLAVAPAGVVLGGAEIDRTTADTWARRFALYCLGGK